MDNDPDTFHLPSDGTFRIVMGCLIGMFVTVFILAIALLFAMIFFPHALDTPITQPPLLETYDVPSQSVMLDVGTERSE